MPEDKTIRITQSEYRHLLENQHTLHMIETALVEFTTSSTWRAFGLDEDGLIKVLRVIDPVTFEEMQARAIEIQEDNKNEED